MSREIKFRLRNRHNKIVGYEKWYSGSYNEDEQYYVAKPCWMYSVDGERWTPKFIEHRFKDQFTGLKDKNGKEVYEGDIIQTYMKENMEGSIVIIKYLDHSFCQAHPDDTDSMDCVWYYIYEVLGNIHENPELLEATNAN